MSTLNLLELAPKVVFESSCSNEEKIEFLEWVDPDIEHRCNFDKLGISQETTFPTLRIATMDQEEDPFSPKYTWNPIPSPSKSFGSTSKSKAHPKKSSQTENGYEANWLQ